MGTWHVSLKLEHRPALQMCSVTCEQSLVPCFQLKVGASTIKLSSDYHDSSIDLKLGDEYSIELDSLGSWNSAEWIREDSTEAWMTTKISICGTIRLKLAAQPDHKVPTRSVEVLPDDVPYGVHCKTCDILLTRENWICRRVLPLPSENWRSLQDMWFCHKHPHNSAEHEKTAAPCGDRENGQTKTHNVDTENSIENSIEESSEVLTRNLLPKPDDMFYSNTRLMLHVAAMSRNSKADARTRSILCGGCSSVVGRLDTRESFLFNRMNVDLRDVNTSRVINSRNPLNFVAKLIREHLAHGGAHCRFILRSESSGDTLLIWVLESDILVYGKEFTLAKSERRTGSVVFDQHHHVLYQCTQRSAPLVQVWSSELTVSSESIDQNTFNTLKDHLIESTETFLTPKGDESFDQDFKVGYVPALPV